MVVLLVFHLVQVVIDSAYRAPREFNFWFGVILLFITLATSLTGYLLPWDQKGFWATKVATNLAGVVPVIGGDIQKVVVGGSDYGHHTLTRFFALDAGVLPASLIGLIVFIIFLLRKQGITRPNHAPKAGANSPTVMPMTAKTLIAKFLNKFLVFIFFSVILQEHFLPKFFLELTYILAHMPIQERFY